MNRRTVALLILAVIFMNLIPIEARAADISGTCGWGMNWVLDENGTLTISGDGWMLDYYYEDPAPWKQYADLIKHAVIEDGVVNIGEFAFYSCNNLASVEIPNSVTRIGKCAFFGAGLESVEIPDSVTSIGSSAFCGCRNMTTVKLPKNITKIEVDAFSACQSLTSVTIPDGVTHLEDGAFSECGKIDLIIIPDSLVYIHDFAFNFTTFGEMYYGGTFEMWDSLTRFMPGSDIRHFSCTEPEGHWERKSREATCGRDGGIFEVCLCGWRRDIERYPATGEHVFDREKIHSAYVVQYHTDWLGRKAEYYKSCACGAAGTETFESDHNYENELDGICDVISCGARREEVEHRIVVHMFRLYNPNTGEHFYTGSTEERDNLVSVGWQYEGVGFTFPANTGAPVYRLFHEPTGEHLYTMNEQEKDNLLLDGWSYEGIAFNSAYNTEAVQYRLYNPNATCGAYHFTFSLEERQNLLDAGWIDQGIGWYSCWK